MSISTFFWDCDGTLVDSEFLAMQVALDTIYGHFGESSPSHLISDLAGYSFPQICKHFEAKFNVVLSTKEYEELNRRQLEQTIRVLSGSVEPTPGTLENLLFFQAQGKEQAVVTSSALSRVNPCIDRLLPDGSSLRRFFDKDRVFSAEDPRIFPDGPRNKPDPSIYLYAMQSCGKQPEECLTFEDSTSGVQAAVRAGITVIGYTGGKHIDPSEKGQADKASALREAAAAPGTGYEDRAQQDIIIVRHMSEVPAAVKEIEERMSFSAEQRMLRSPAMNVNVPFPVVLSPGISGKSI